MKTAAMALIIVSTVLLILRRTSADKGGGRARPTRVSLAPPDRRGRPVRLGPGLKSGFRKLPVKRTHALPIRNANERILSAYVQNGAGNVVVNDPRRASYRPARASSGGTLVLVCISQ